MEHILAALRQLDPLNDDHWTANGDPRIDAVKSFVTDGVDVDRQTIVNAAPDFNRENAANPENLIMNKGEEKPKEGSEGSQVLDDDDDEILIEDPDLKTMDAHDLAGNADGVVKELIEKALLEGKSLNDQEMLVLMNGISADELPVFLTLSEMTQNAHQKASDLHLEEVKNYRRMVAITKQRLNVVRPEKSNGDAIRDYLVAQQEERIRASKQRQAILKNLDAKSINPLSQLDQAMARKNGRGTQRPSY